jgi:hypothetical protein
MVVVGSGARCPVGSVMERFVVRANIDNYVSLLNADVLLSPDKKSIVVKLLMAEEDKLSQRSGAA